MDKKKAGTGLQIRLELVNDKTVIFKLYIVSWTEINCNIPFDMIILTL
jgi:hypothetical protein